MSEYITLRDAIEFYGRWLICGWQGDGVERHAPSRGELIAERTKILEMPAKTILADERATSRNRMKRLEREHAVGTQPLTSIDDALGKLRAETAGTTDKNRKAALERTLARLDKLRTAKQVGRSRHDLVNEHRNYLLTELEKLQTPAVAARERWDTMHDRLRRAVAHGDLRAYVRLPLDGSPLGIINPLAAELFPEPCEWRIDIPFGANGERFPAEVVFVRADLEQVFPVLPKPARGVGTPKVNTPVEGPANSEQKDTNRENSLAKARKIADAYIADCERKDLVPKMTAKLGD